MQICMQKLWTGSAPAQTFSGMNSTIRAQRRTKAFKSPDRPTSPKNLVGVPRTTKRSSPSSPASGTPPPAPVREAKLATQLLTEVAAGSPDIGVLCETYGMRREELSRLTGFSLRALADWSSGKLPSQPAQRRLQEIRRFLDALTALVQPTAIPTWMRNPNPAFGRLTPLQVIELGEIDRLWAMIHERG